MYNSDKSIYIVVGKEGEVMERTAKELFDKLEKNQKPNILLIYKYFEDKSHGDAFDKIFNAKKIIDLNIFEHKVPLIDKLRFCIIDPHLT